MKFSFSFCIPLFLGVHAFHDIYTNNGGLSLRNFDGLASFNTRDLESMDLYPKLRVRSVTRSQLFKRGGCMSKGCTGTRPSNGQQRGRQQQQGQQSQARPQQQGQQPQRQQQQHGQQSQGQQQQRGRQQQSGRSSPRRDHSISPPRSQSSSFSSLVSGDNIRWGALDRDSPSWDARRPARATSQAAQGFTNSLRNQVSNPPSHGSGDRITAGSLPGAQSGSSSSRQPQSEIQHPGQHGSSGAVSLASVPSDTRPKSP